MQIYVGNTDIGVGDTTLVAQTILNATKLDLFVFFFLWEDLVVSRNWLSPVVHDNAAPGTENINHIDKEVYLNAAVVSEND